jgi:hypothetical protein
MSLRLPSVFVLPAVLILAGMVAAVAPPPAPLTAEDRALLQGMLKECLFDPHGCRYVRGKVGDEEREGWLKADPTGGPGWVYFTDGEGMPASSVRWQQPIDYADLWRRFLDSPKERHWPGCPLAAAAWLFRLGHESLAARALSGARTNARVRGIGSDRDLVAELRSYLARSSLEKATEAYHARSDSKALAHIDRLFRLYPEEARDPSFQQAHPLRRMLHRKLILNTLGRPRSLLSPRFAGWGIKQKIAYLLAELEEIDVAQDGMGAGIAFFDSGPDWCVQELVRIGEPAVPALIDTIALDDRPTRVVLRQRIVPVSEVALRVVFDILQVANINPTYQKRPWTWTPETPTETVALLRAYWAKYGALPFDERMMNILTDLKSTPAARREAARKLSWLGYPREALGWRVVGYNSDKKTTNPAIAKFDKPTVAEAILAAMDLEPAGSGKTAEGWHPFWEDQEIETPYLKALIDLGDGRIAAELARRSRRATRSVTRRVLAAAAHRLGDSVPLQAFAHDFAAGRVALPKEAETAHHELTQIVRNFTETDLPETRQALAGLTGPRHPLHTLASARVLVHWFEEQEGSVWFHSPAALVLLRPALTDERPTGADYEIEGGGLVVKTAGMARFSTLPEDLTDPKKRIDKARERSCDRAALAYQTLVVGMPYFHPLHKDAEQELALIRRTVQRCPVAYRPLRPEERGWLKLEGRTHPWFVPDIALSGAATEEDVKAGRALFHLDPQARRAPLVLPAVGLLVRGKDKPTPVLILQAEIGPDGRTSYGVVGQRVMGVYLAHEVVNVRPLTPVPMR